MFDFDALNPTFQDPEAFINLRDDIDELEELDPNFIEMGDEDDDFPEMLEYDDWKDDMYADGDGFYTNQDPW